MDIVDKILGLKELGYSKEEIDKLLNPPAVEELYNEYEINESENKEEKEPEPKSEGTFVNVDNSETNERLRTIEDTLKAIQANNVKWSNMPEVKEKTELEIVQEILGGINKDGNE